MNRLNVGILIFDGVEVLDFAGPYQVFSALGRNRAWPRVAATCLLLSKYSPVGRHWHRSRRPAACACCRTTTSPQCHTST